jgi:hypothetical protein
MSWQLVMAVRLILGFEDPLLVTIYRIVIVILILFFFSMIYKKKLKSYYKNILELAARPVDGTENGFTSRPYPFGSAVYSQHEIIQFGKFCSRNLIAMPYSEGDKLILVLAIDKLKDIAWKRDNYSDLTYISFDKDGKVEVNISQNDYGKYKDELTFDHLCSSLGNLFIEFLNLFRDNKSGEILKRLNSVEQES